MPDRPTHRQSRMTLADIMIPIASTAGLFGVVRACTSSVRIEPHPDILFQTGLVAAALFLSLGGFGTCAARLRGRPRFEGFCWGFICGPFGVLMIGLMPAPREDRPHAASGDRPDDEHGQVLVVEDHGRCSKESGT